MKSRDSVDIYAIYIIPQNHAPWGPVFWKDDSPIVGPVPGPLDGTAGQHIPQTPASFILLENLPHWFSKEYDRKSCVMGSLGMLFHLALEFIVVL